MNFLLESVRWTKIFKLLNSEIFPSLMDCCKVGTVAAKRQLTVRADLDIHDYLVARWLGIKEYPEMGVRKLADWFNKQIIREAYASHGRNITDVRVSSEYEALTSGGDVERGEVIDDLKSDGIDGEELIDDFVSRSTMRRHLADCLDVSKNKPSSNDSTSDWELDQIRHSREHLQNNVSESVRSLANKNRLPGGTEAEIEVPIFLSCPECSTQVRLETALDRHFICKEHLGVSSVDTSEMFNSSD